MAQESCNLDKEEPELLKPPSSAPSSNPAPPQPATAPAPALYLKPTSSSQDQHIQLHQQQQLQQQLQLGPSPNPLSPTSSMSSCFSRKRKLNASLLHPPPESDAVAAADLQANNKAQKSDSATDAPTAAAAAKSAVNRCTGCNKRVGLTGFRCRCGELFCAQHRYSDAHGCTFDYKAAGRVEISKANPLVRAPKIIKI